MENAASRKRNNKNKKKNKGKPNTNGQNGQNKTVASENIIDKKIVPIQVKNALKENLNLPVTSQIASDPKNESAKIPAKIINDPFLSSLQKKMEVAIANGGADLPNTLLENLQKLIKQEPVSDVASSDEEEEYVEYIYKPRQYFAVSICNFCKSDLRNTKLTQCSKCKMTFYCSPEHMKSDETHRQLCYGLRQVADSYGGHIFYKCGEFTPEQFRSYRIIAIRKVESIINRQLTACEQEVLLFPRICCNINCREYRFNKLTDCTGCGQVSFCKATPEHLQKYHHLWCRSYQLFKEMIIFQEKFGKIDPSMPTKVLKDLPLGCANMKQICTKLAVDLKDECEYAALSQIATGPLTAWYTLKVFDKLRMDTVTVHLIGAEIEFEVDLLHKWELFFLHITPAVKELNVVFIGPELNPRNISFDQLKKTKPCRSCRKNNRTVKYYFENGLYHNYCKGESYLKPDLICFFNPGLYRPTGFQMEDTWPETIEAAVEKKCPVVITSYTQHEAPMDLSRFILESNRHLDIVIPPTVNPFGSVKPERNFISDEEAPLMYKNYYCFAVE
ncbi:uncharacterized protein LOC129918474 [Episyrphus balteatus]|uniref:uncharacterized protein LOC129918474 n=1 Tax=Episyrphus balteatus TaxID=286459 RepID=UPI0024865E98|nr:uncharacterized protein LOC129918474 [Episyrphus balteatus]